MTSNSATDFADLKIRVYIPVGKSWHLQNSVQDIAEIIPGVTFIGGSDELIYECHGTACAEFRRSLIAQGFAPHF